MKPKVLISSFIVSFLIFVGILYFQFNQNPYGADGSVFVGGQTYRLSGSGITSSATSIGLTSFGVYKSDGTFHELTTSEVAGSSGSVYLTIEPGNPTRQEFVSCTTVTQGSGTTATLSGCSRGLLPFSDYTASTTYAFPHVGGQAIIVSNGPAFYDKFAGKNNDESISGTWTFADSPLLTTDCTVASGNTEICAKAYIDGVAVAGASNANLTTKGIVEMGTQAENVASTQLGDTGAWLAQASNYATNTPNTATRNNVDIWSGATGYLAQGWLNLTEAFTWTGAHIFSALATFNGGLTSTATTTLSGSSLTNNAIVINGLAYQWPSANVSNVLKNDGNGNLSWGRPTKYSWSIDPTDAEDGAWSTTTLGTIPANTLTASSTISISQAGSSQPYNGGAYTIYIRTSTGETLFGHTCAGGTNSANTLCTSTGLVTFISATSQKYSSEGMSHLSTGANGALDGGVGTASIDFTQEKTLQIVLKGDGSGDARMTSVSVVINP